MFAPVLLTKEECLSPPSCAYGMLLTEEIELRRSYELFLRTAGLLLGFITPRHVIAVATTYFHIVASRLSLTLIDRPSVLVQSILFLAAKSEEEHRRLRDIITVVYRMMHPDPNDWLHLGDGHAKLRDHIVTTEQLVLRLLGFNLNVDLPYKYLFNYLKKLNASQGLAKLATAVLNDFYPFSIVIEYKPSVLAAACLFMAIELAGSSSAAYDTLSTDRFIGGGSSQINSSSPTLAEDCMKALFVDLHQVLEISSRAMEFYNMEPAAPLKTSEAPSQNSTQTS